MMNKNFVKSFLFFFFSLGFYTKKTEVERYISAKGTLANCLFCVRSLTNISATPAIFQEKVSHPFSKIIFTSTIFKRLTQPSPTRLG